MKIQKIVIDNFKSLNQFKLENPNPFSVFVGANGVGKSNIFEALEFLNYSFLENQEVEDLFGGYKSLLNDKRFNDDILFQIQFKNNLLSKYHIGKPNASMPGHNVNGEKIIVVYPKGNERVRYSEGIFSGYSEKSFFENYLYEQFVKRFSRIFINASDKKKLNTTSDNKLNLDCSNLEKVLKRLLSDNNIREEIADWLALFIPAFKNIEVSSDELSGTDTLLFHEKNSDKPFTKNLISDGTYNILCLLTAIYQSNTPQFICIEEPENGLNPYVVKELVTFFREQCKEKGHYIWLNTHSQTLVNQLKPEEIIVVNKEGGNTIAKQFIGKDMHGMAMDTAWLTNFFGGGVPW